MKDSERVQPENINIDGHVYNIAAAPLKVVTIKKGTKLVHGQNSKGKDLGLSKGGSFFTANAQTNPHLGTKRYTATYEVTSDIKVFYVWNLYVFAAQEDEEANYVGNNFVERNGLYRNILSKMGAAFFGLRRAYIWGYMGCNECEIFLEWKAIVTKTKLISCVETVLSSKA